MDEAQLCCSSLPTGPIALPALGRSRPGLKNPTWLIGFKPQTFQPTVRVGLTTVLWGLVCCVCSLYVWTKFPEMLDEVPPMCLKFPQITYIRKRMFSFIFMRLTWVVELYTSLQLVEGVYKPQWACVGWAIMIELCRKACMWIKCTCLNEVPPRHPSKFIIYISALRLQLHSGE